MLKSINTNTEENLWSTQVYYFVKNSREMVK